ncbi:MAG TPA: hypothetical protein VJ953_11900 [Saprospiraceae bacterium]|nr:hypothetical protein [Saprospiraceae bacterium]
MHRENKVYRLLACLIFCTLAFSGYGQKVDSEDIIYLKDGSVLKGQISSYERGQSLLLDLHNGQQVVLEDKEIAKIVQEAVKPRKKVANPLEKGSFYHAFYFSGNLGSNHYKTNDWGIGLEHVSGYWVSDKIGLGLGGGIQQFSGSYAWRIAPVFLDMKYKLNADAASPFYLGGDFGIGFPLKNENTNVIGGSPGERFRLGVGKIWTLPSSTRLSLEFSYLHHRTEFDSLSWNWWSEDVISRNIRFKRYQLRFGFLF